MSGPTIETKEARKLQASLFLREVLVPATLKGQKLTRDFLTGAVLTWRQTHQGTEGGENLMLGWVEGELLLREIGGDIMARKGEHEELAQIYTRIINQFEDVDIVEIDRIL